MISYHPIKPTGSNARVYASGFKSAQVDAPFRIANCVREFVWSPCVWRDGRRLQENFLGADWAVLDYDTGELSLDEAIRKYCDMVHIIGTTKSHGVEKGGRVADRFRVLLKWAAPITDLRVFRYNMWKLLKQLDEADQQCRDAARFYYPCKQIVSISAEGFTEEIDPAVPDWFESRVPPSFIRDRMTVGPWVKRQLTEVIPTGKRNNACYGIAKELTFIGVPESEIIAAILKSPTYSQSSVDAKLLREITETVRRGIKRGLEELRADGVDV